MKGGFGLENCKCHLTLSFGKEGGEDKEEPAHVCFTGHGPSFYLTGKGGSLEQG